MQSDLESERTARQEGVSRIAELEATASTLTEWNTSLEQQCSTLMESLCQQREISNQVKCELQQDLLTTTKKQIDLRGEVDHMEEENIQLRRTLRESMDIQEKLAQENAILKSKMYNIATGEASAPLALSHFRISPELAPRMEDVDLSSQRGIGDILKQLKMSTRIR